MSLPFYVSPEQIIRDKADFARKGIARGRSVVVCQCTEGILFVAENPSRALHKVSEIHDRVGFAAVGRYNEFENLRVAGIRFADLRGYAYDRADVTGRSLANVYAQALGTVFTDNVKPYEVEIVVAEVGPTAAADEIYRLTFDGSVADEQSFVVIGGTAEDIAAALRQQWTEPVSRTRTLQLAVAAIAEGSEDHVAPAADTLEVALLDRTRAGRRFRRLERAAVAALLG
ncbi:MAG: proteasome subunit alpha [Actinomycetales bacterium]|nr:proteasome subunit alpha [Actinomycetales bacterium]